MIGTLTMGLFFNDRLALIVQVVSRYCARDVKCILYYNITLLLFREFLFSVYEVYNIDIIVVSPSMRTNNAM